LESLRGKAAVAGVGESLLGKVAGKSTFAFSADASRAAIADAGIEKHEIDAIFTWASGAVDPFPYYAAALAEYLGLPIRYGAALDMGGAAFGSAVGVASMALAHGLCRTALVVTGENRRTGKTRDGKSVWEERGRVGYGHPEFEAPFGPVLPSFYALCAQRHMHLYGTKPEHLAEVAVTCRRHAPLTPGSVQTEPITVQDVLDSPMISSPLHLLDCCPIADGGAAVIVTTPERARALRRPPVYVLGVGEGHKHVNATWMPDMTVTGAAISGPAAFRMAGLTPRDVHTAQVYDAFTILPIMFLEDLGFCAKGAGGPFVEGGRIGLGGELPINTDGGGLSHCQHGSSGLWHIIEAVRQVRGERGAAQVKGAQVALAHTNGGHLATQATVILGGEAAL